MSPRKPGTPDEGKPEDAKLDVAAQDAKEAASVEAASEAKPKTRRRLRRKAEPEAEGTAAEVTGVDKDVAEAATKEGASEPVAEEPAPADQPAPAEEPAPAEPEPAVAAKADAPEADAEAAPAPRPRRARRKAAPEAPAPARKRGARDYGDTPPMVRAHAKYVRTSARKARLVCDHIRGKSVEEARAILAHANRDVARDWSKLLESAVANAEHNHELIGDELRIHAVKADEGPTLKRFRPRAMGRATKIRKRTSHLSITLTPKDEDR
ncbi:MAG: large subunit ribosomal protein [Solirubrobacteraceae bacterium]|jgi:ribosomal protein L22|nr:large subunit ribosomal protein [Solirubrobacteraceae bacterium]